MQVRAGRLIPCATAQGSPALACQQATATALVVKNAQRASHPAKTRGPAGPGPMAQRLTLEMMWCKSGTRPPLQQQDEGGQQPLGFNAGTGGAMNAGSGFKLRQTWHGRQPGASPGG